MSDVITAIPDPESGQSWSEEILMDVMRALHPECPAFPGILNNCHPIMCDCGNGDNSGPGLGAQVKALVEDNEQLRKRVAELEAACGG